MVELKTNEQLIYFMIHNLRLSRHDSRFLENLEKLINSTCRVTTNQAELVHKLIEKYQRQLIKHELFIETLLELPWKTMVVKTTEEYTSAHIGIVEDNIVLKTPYNKNFIGAFRSSSPNGFIWDNVNKYYISDLSTHSLKYAINITKKFFVVRYSDNVNKLLNQLTTYSNATCWSPTLVCCNGNYMIASTNDALDKAIAHIPLNTELKTLAELTRYGIVVDESLLITDEEYFAASYNPQVELESLGDIVPWLSNIGCDYVYVSGSGLTSAVKMKNDFKTNLSNAGIQYADTIKFIRPNTEKYKFPVSVRFRLITDFNEPANLAKVINIVNSQPVNLEKNETM